MRKVDPVCVKPPRRAHPDCTSRRPRSCPRSSRSTLPLGGRAAGHGRRAARHPRPRRDVHRHERRHPHLARLRRARRVPREQGATLTIATHSKKVDIDLGVIESQNGSGMVGYREKPTLDLRRLDGHLRLRAARAGVPARRAVPVPRPRPAPARGRREVSPPPRPDAGLVRHRDHRPSTSARFTICARGRRSSRPDWGHASRTGRPTGAWGRSSVLGSLLRPRASDSAVPPGTAVLRLRSSAGLGGVAGRDDRAVLIVRAGRPGHGGPDTERPPPTPDSGQSSGRRWRRAGPARRRALPRRSGPRRTPSQRPTGASRRPSACWTTDSNRRATRRPPAPRGRPEAAEESSLAAPAEASSQGRPTEDSSFAAPTEESSFAAPTEDSSFAAPTEDSSFEAPTEESSFAAPTEESSV